MDVEPCVEEGLAWDLWQIVIMNEKSVKSSFASNDHIRVPGKCDIEYVSSFLFGKYACNPFCI